MYRELLKTYINKHTVTIGTIMISLLVFFMLLLSCNPFFDIEEDDWNTSGKSEEPSFSVNSRQVTFNFSEAVAVGASNVLDEANSRRIRLNSNQASLLVKILKDSSIELAFDDCEGDFYIPPVNFLARSPDTEYRDLYVSFKGSFMSGYEVTDENYENYVYKYTGSFLHFREDGTFIDIPNLLNDTYQLKDTDDMEGFVSTYSWDEKRNFIPIAFDKQNRVFFIFNFYLGNQGYQILCRYNPEVESVKIITPIEPGYDFQSFSISPDGEFLVVNGQRYGSEKSSSFFHVYRTETAEKVNTIYDSKYEEIDGFAFKFRITPDSQKLIVNGWNFMGTTGIISVTDYYTDTPNYTPINCFQGSHFSLNDLFNVSERFESLFIAITDGKNVKYARPTDTSNEYMIYKEIGSHQIESTKKLDDIGYFFSTNPDNLLHHTSQQDSTKLNALPIVFFSSYDSVSPQPVSNRVAHQIKKDLIDQNFNTCYYFWKPTWYINEDITSGEIDTNGLMNFLSSKYIHDVDFLYSELTGIDALKNFIDNEPYRHDEEISNENQFLNSYLVKKGTTNTRPLLFSSYVDENDYLWLRGIRSENLFFDDQGKLWAVIEVEGFYKIVLLLGFEGERNITVLKNLESMHIESYIYTDMNMYLLVSKDGIGSSHTIYRISLEYFNDSPVNVLKNVPRHENYSIVDFSVTDQKIYFVGDIGDGNRGGVVDLITLDFTAFYGEYELTQIQAY